jgi:hypothetical protein
MSIFNKNTVAVCLALSLALVCGRGGRADGKAADKAEDTTKPAAPFKVVRVLKGHHNSVYEVSFSPDGKLLASGGDQSLCIWETATGKLVKEVALDNSPLTHAAFVDGGRVIACSPIPNRILYLLDTPSGKVRTRINLSGKRLSSMAPSPDGKFLACLVSGSPLDVILLDLTSGKRQWCIHYREQVNCPQSIAVTPDGKAVAVGMDDKSVRFYHVASGKELRRLIPVHKDSSLGALKFAPNGKLLAVGVHLESAVRLLDATTGKVLREIRWTHPPSRDEGGVWFKEGSPELFGLWNLAFSPDGKMLAVTCRDGKIRLWEVATGGLRRETAQAVAQLAFSPNNSVLALGSPRDGDVQLCDWLHHDLKPSPLTAERFEWLWGDLVAKDAAVAYRAMAELAASPQQAVPLLGKRLRRVLSVSPAQLDRLVADLDSTSLEVRKRAFRQLAALERAAEPALREALTRRPTLELRQRVNELLDRLSLLGPDQWRQLRIIELLEYLRTPEARRVLRQIADRKSGVLETEDAKAALRRLTQFSGP